MVRGECSHSAYVSLSQMHMHGNNMATLYSHVHDVILPAELGGPGPPYNLSSWAKTLIGDENFSFDERHIYWPDHSSCRKYVQRSFTGDRGRDVVRNCGWRHQPRIAFIQLRLVVCLVSL